MNNIKAKKHTRNASRQRKSIEAFSRFVDFMYKHPDLMQEFPKTIVFRDEGVELAFDGKEKAGVAI